MRFDEREQQFPGIFKQWVTDPYCQFPLCLLGMIGNKDKLKLIENAVIYGLVKTAKEIMKHQTLERSLPIASIRGLDKKKPRHRAIGSSLEYHEVNCTSMEVIRSTWNECHRFMKEHRNQDRTQIRMPTKLLINLMHDDEISERDFRILCAIRSKLGQSGWAITRREEIRLRAAGASNQLALARMNAESLTEDQVKRGMEKLQRLGFFTRVVLNRRITFIGDPNKYPEEALERLAAEWWHKRRDAGKAKQVWIMDE